MPRHVVVVGGGFAGLRAAVTLADAGRRVTLLESRNSLGGRARSFTDPATGDVVDNGQHLFLGGYHRTLAFLDRLGTRDKLVFQTRLRVRFAEPGGAGCTLDCPPLPAPWHLIGGMLRLQGIPLKDKLGLFRIWSEIMRTPHPSPSPQRGEGRGEGETVEQWLNRLGQGEKSRKLFWDPLTIAALNEDPKKASAVGLKRVLQTMMGKPWPNSRLGMASVGLTDLYAEPARRIIEQKGGQVRLNRPAAGLEISGGRVQAVRLADGSRIEADAVISALPPAALLRLLPPDLPECEGLARSLRQFRSSPILSVNLWLDRPVTEEFFVALVGCRFQWLFNKQAILRLAGIEAGYVSLIISAADGFLDRSNEDLVRMALEDLRACFPKALPVNAARSQVVRERDATVSLTPETEKLRPGPKTPLAGLFLAGDWTATGLPATVESAVLSGEQAARLAITGAA